MKVLVINSGSSSLKYQFVRTRDQLVLTKGLVEKIGGDAEYSYVDQKGEKIRTSIEAKNHKQALTLVIENISKSENGFVKSLDEIEAVGHRVVHGGEEFASSVLVDDAVIASIQKFAELAPLHNPPNLEGILACREILPKIPQVAVFDTAFHQTMPESSYLYAIPYKYYESRRVRRYGFHGTSHRYVTLKTAEFLEKPVDQLNIITCHLGNGSSITAVKNGESVDTSMGFTPLEGVVMGTRSGSIDPAIIFYLMEKENLSTSDINTILNKKSGLLGVSGVSNDLREIWEESRKGNHRATIARELLIKSIRKYIGVYLVDLGRVDAIVFTAGIGENDYEVREKSVQGLESFGIEMDTTVNAKVRSELRDLSTANSKIKVLMIPTNEELMIALDTEEVLKA